MNETTIRFDSKLLRHPTVHRWFARRTSVASASVVLLANDPALAFDPSGLMRAASEVGSSAAPLDGHRMLDLCSGATTVGLAAARMGGQVSALDNHPVAVLIGRCLLEYGPLLGSSDHDHGGIGAGRTWAGLERELRYWSDVFVDRMRAATGDAWLEGIDAVICRPLTLCPNCQAPTDMATNGSSRGSAVCSACTIQFARRGADIVGFEPVREKRGRADEAVSDEVRSVLATAEMPAGWVAEESFVSTRIGTVPVSRAVTPRQAFVLAASQQTLRSVRDDLTEHGYEPRRVAALITALGLTASSALVEVLTTATRWDDRTRRPQGLNRHEWVFAPEFAEIGGSEIQRRFERQVNDACEALTAAAVSGAAVSGDMTAIASQDGSFDVVVWDPPFYDNIDYQSLAVPWVRYLRAAIGELHLDLDWVATSSPSPIEPFDAIAYTASLAEASSEIARVLRPDGTLGVFWIRRGQDEQDLSDLLEGLEASGLELVQSIVLDTSTGKLGGGSREPVFLVFRKTVIVQPTNAAQIVAGLDENRPLMAAGLADLLEKYLDDDDLAELIPPNFRGTRRQQLQEAVMADRDPLSLVKRLRRRELAEFVEEQTPNSATGLKTDDLAELALESMGWRIPRPAGFSIGAALDECERQVSVLQFTTSDAEARGAAKAALSEIEGILRFAVVAWAHLVDGDDWQRPIAPDTVGPIRFSLGQWRRLFTEFPSQQAGALGPLGRTSKRLRQAKVGPSLDNVVALRNDIDHPDRAPWEDVRPKASKVLSDVIAALRNADDRGALPRVLQPSTETRDPYGRITLRMVAHDGRSTEFLMTRSSDLTVPIVYFPGDSNPREVHPVSISAPEVQERSGVQA